MTYRWQRKMTKVDHADDWLMTYADMITLLLCFFAVILATYMPKKEIPPKVETPKPVEQQIYPAPSPSPVLDGNLPFHEITADDIPPDNNEFAKPTEMPLAAPVPVTVVMPAVAVSEPAPPPVPVVAPEKPVEDAPRGDRITTIQMDSAAFFDRGSATISEAGKSILRDVASNLKSEQFQGYRITVEGHTDDTPIDTPQFPSNWELSTARASAVVHFFLEQGIPANTLRAAGYADTFPLVPNRDASGSAIPANQARNRRVVIKLEKIEKPEQG